MANIQMEMLVQAVTILGGTVALLLAVLQIVETYLDIGEKLRKQRLRKKQKPPDQPAQPLHMDLCASIRQAQSMPAEILETGYYVETGIDTNRKLKLFEAIGQIFNIDEDELKAEVLRKKQNYQNFLATINLQIATRFVYARINSCILWGTQSNV